MYLNVEFDVHSIQTLQENTAEVRKVAEEHGILFWMAGILLFMSPDADSQDPAFSQFYANPLFMNPAMAGVEGPAKFSLGYRNQWPGATNPAEETSATRQSARGLARVAGAISPSFRQG